MYRTRLFIISLLIIISTGCDDNRKPIAIDINGTTMGTYYKVTLIGNSQTKSQALQSEIESILAIVNSQMSTYQADSEVSTFNHNSSLGENSVSEDLAFVVQKSIEIFKQSNGKFDITVSPLISLWSFGEDKRPLKKPSELELSDIRQYIGSDKLDIQLNPAMLKKAVGKLQINLSAIAKGFAVDKITQYFDSLNMDDYLIDIGGELTASGHNVHGESWRIGIEIPDSQLMHSVQQVVSISGKSMATSGSYRNYFELDGQRFSHIIDPSTGYPIDHNLVSVTVVSDDCMTADAYATTLMVMGPREGYDFALQNGLAVYMIEKKGDEFLIEFSPQMKGFMD